MSQAITIELFTRSSPSWGLRRRLEKAGIRVRSMGVAHLFVDVAAATPLEAVERLAPALSRQEIARFEPRPLVGYLDDLPAA